MTTPQSNWPPEVEAIFQFEERNKAQKDFSNVQRAAYDLENGTNMHECECVVCERKFECDIRSQKYCGLKCCLNDWEKKNPQR